MPAMLNKTLNIKDIFKSALSIFAKQGFVLMALALIILAPPTVFALLLPSALNSEPVNIALDITSILLEMLFLACVFHTVIAGTHGNSVSIINMFDQGLSSYKKMLLTMLAIMTLFGLASLIPLSVIYLLEELSLMLFVKLSLIPVIIGFMMLAIRTICVLPSAIIENRDIKGAFIRSFDLTRGYSWHVFSVLLLLMLFGAFVNMLFVKCFTIESIIDEMTLTFFLIANFLFQAVVMTCMSVMISLIYVTLRGIYDSRPENQGKPTSLLDDEATSLPDLA